MVYVSHFFYATMGWSSELGAWSLARRLPIMNKARWYWHRLRAMAPAELAAHGRKKIRQWRDTRHLPDWSGLALEPTGNFPKVPLAEAAPPVLREALARDAKEI